MLKFTATVTSIEWVRTSPMGHAVYEVTTDWGRYNTKSDAHIGLNLAGAYGKAMFEGKRTRITLSARGTITDMKVAGDDGDDTDVTVTVHVPAGALGSILDAGDIALAAQEYVNETVAGGE